MSIVRALDGNGDWQFGKGINNYISGNAQIAQDIQTRLLSFLGDCFFDTSAGVDWFNLLGAKNQTALNLNVASVILNTAGVTGGLELNVNYTPSNRNLTISYNVTTVYTVLSNSFQYNINV